MHPDDQQPDDLHPDAPDVAALKRRVLLTGALALVGWFAALWVLDALGLGPLYALGAAVVLYVVLVRPLMRPVREAVALRRRLAYQAWLEHREQEGGPGGPSTS